MSGREEAEEGVGHPEIHFSAEAFEWVAVLHDTGERGGGCSSDERGGERSYLYSRTQRVLAKKKNAAH